MSSSGSAPRRKAAVSPLLLILAIIAVMGAVRWLGLRNEPLRTTATLSVQQGEVTVTRADAGNDPPYTGGATTKLQSADQAQVSPDGRAQLTFGGEATLSIGGNGRLTILNLYRQSMTRNLVVNLALDQGEMLINAPDSLRPITFEIETRVAVVSTSGQTIKIQVIDKNRTRIAVYEGQAKVIMGDQELPLEAGKEVDVQLGAELQARPASDLPPAIAPVATNKPEGQPKATLEDWEKTLFPSVTTPTVPGDEYQWHTVQAGETLSSISRLYGLSWKVIYDLNRDLLSSPETIKPGQRLRIPKP